MSEIRVSRTYEGQPLDEPAGWDVWDTERKQFVGFEPNSAYVHREYVELSRELGNFGEYWVEVRAYKPWGDLARLNDGKGQ